MVWGMACSTQSNNLHGWCGTWLVLRSLNLHGWCGTWLVLRSLTTYMDAVGRGLFYAVKQLTWMVWGMACSLQSNNLHGCCGALLVLHSLTTYMDGVGHGLFFAVKQLTWMVWGIPASCKEDNICRQVDSQSDTHAMSFSAKFFCNNTKQRYRHTLNVFLSEALL